MFEKANEALIRFQPYAAGSVAASVVLVCLISGAATKNPLWLVIAFLLVISGIFVGLQFSLGENNPALIQKLLKDRDSRAYKLMELENFEEGLTALLIGSAMISVLCTDLFLEELASKLGAILLTFVFQFTVGEVLAMAMFKRYHLEANMAFYPIAHRLIPLAKVVQPVLEYFQNSQHGHGEGAQGDLQNIINLKCEADVVDLLTAHPTLGREERLLAVNALRLDDLNLADIAVSVPEEHFFELPHGGNPLAPPISDKDPEAFKDISHSEIVLTDSGVPYCVFELADYLQALEHEVDDFDLLNFLLPAVVVNKRKKVAAILAYLKPLISSDDKVGDRVNNEIDTQVFVKTSGEYRRLTATKLAGEVLQGVA